jgi:hypothetical protein
VGEELAPADHRCDRQAAAEGLAATEEIGPDAVVLDGEEAAAAAEAGEDLVRDEQGAAAARELGEGAQPSFGRQHDALAAQDGLDENGADRALRERRVELVGRSAELSPHDVRREVREEGARKLSREVAASAPNVRPCRPR